MHVMNSALLCIKVSCACCTVGIVCSHARPRPDMMLTSWGMQAPLPPPAVGERFNKFWWFQFLLTQWAGEQSLLDEVTHQVRRLSPHPSIILYTSCNECGTSAMYDQVLTRVVHEDISRIVWPASPSDGWTTGVDPATGLPTAFNVPLVPNAVSGIYHGTREQHG